MRVKRHEYLAFIARGGTVDGKGGSKLGSSPFEKGKCWVHEMEDTGGGRKEREG
jgi:hypothetical protein